MATAAATLTEGATTHVRFRPDSRGFAARVIGSIILVGAILATPLLGDIVWDDRIALAAIFGIIGLSINVLTGHAGQISLGHQAFVGIGAFISAFVVTEMNLGFEIALPLAGLSGAVLALVLGLIALRIKGLYLALITLSFGLMAETTIFNWRAFTGGGSGALAPRPAAFESSHAYAYLCIAFLGLFVFVDWRLVKSKMGRAIVSIRNDERVAATLGINVTAYKLFAFMLTGFMAGVAGSLFAHWIQIVTNNEFFFLGALVWLLMSVVGGLGSRAGVISGSVFFAIFPFVVQDLAGGGFFNAPLVGEVLIQTLSPLFGALLLLLTITLYPGGIGQQLLPFRRWFSGGLLVESTHEAGQMAGFPLLLGVILGFALLDGSGLFKLGIGVVLGVVLAVLVVSLLRLYLRRAQAAMGRAVTHHAPLTPAAIAEAAGDGKAEPAVEDTGELPVAPELATKGNGGSTRRRKR